MAAPSRLRIHPGPGRLPATKAGTYDPAGPPQPWEAYDDYGHNHWANSIFYGEGIHDFSIIGPGLIHGAGLSFDWAGSHGGYPHFEGKQAGVGNKTIALKNCHNVLLSDFSVLKGGHFVVLATAADNLTLDNLLIDTERDGLDIDAAVTFASQAVR